jgi:DnaJ family protein C protein 28
VQDAVLRMLVDKYKPLRGDFMSSDERLKRAPPKIGGTVPLEDDEAALAAAIGEDRPLAEHLAHARTQPAVAPASGSASSAPPTPSGALAHVPLLPAVEGHRPWHTSYVSPKHTASVKLGRFPPKSRGADKSTSLPGDGTAPRKDVEKLRRRMQAVRLTSARENTLDYRLGLRREAGLSTSGGGGGGAVSMRAWNSLVEERIEVRAFRTAVGSPILTSLQQAIRDGKFAKVTGRGAPLARTAEEHNPFIGREEFLMNRIVRRQGAAPPWIEVQNGSSLPAPPVLFLSSTVHRVGKRA